MAAGSSIVSRRLLIALLVFGLFVLFDLALFGWLIFRSLSEREVEKILLETRDDAETVARQIAARAEQEGGDLYTAIALEHETQTFIDSVLREREIVTTVEVRAADGTLVFRSSRNTTIPVEGGAEGMAGLGTPEVPVSPPPGGSGEIERVERERAFGDRLEDIEVPISDLGSIQIGISPEELDQRVSVLRGELVAQTSVVGLLTMLLLVGGSVAFWLLFRRARRLEEQAAEAERMAYVGTLASGLAHEIRNPLNSLNLNMQMLEEEVGEATAGGAGTGGTSGPRLLSITRSEISRLERLVTDFLAYAKPRPLDLEDVAPAELLERVATLLAPEARRRGARIEIDAACGRASLRVDESQIKQLLLNLAQNALAAIEQSGRAGTLTLAARSAGSSVVLGVRDDGVGIPEETRDKIFDLFYSTRKGGTGLGLAIAQRIVRDHGGRLDLDSTPGVGTVISVSLPAGPPRGLPAHEPIPADHHA